ncbi:unnamed protein product, partial [Cylicostephanus goldi]
RIPSRAWITSIIKRGAATGASSSNCEGASDQNAFIHGHGVNCAVHADSLTDKLYLGEAGTNPRGRLMGDAFLVCIHKVRRFVLEDRKETVRSMLEKVRAFIVQLEEITMHPRAR